MLLLESLQDTVQLLFPSKLDTEVISKYLELNIRSKKSPVEFASYIIERPKCLKTILWKSYPSEIFLASTIQYYEFTNPGKLAVEILSTSSTPPTNPLLLPKAFELWYKLLPLDSKKRSRVRQKCAEAYSNVTLDHEGEVQKNAVIKRALIFLDEPHDFSNARRYFRSYVNQFPKDKLANNSLNWIAWTYCVEANKNLYKKAEFIALYEHAYVIYKEIAKDYPSGHVGKNAKRALKIIKSKLEQVKAGNLEPFQILLPPDIQEYKRTNSIIP